MVLLAVEKRSRKQKQSNFPIPASLFDLKRVILETFTRDMWLKSTGLNYSFPGRTLEPVSGVCREVSFFPTHIG